jgi:lysozyme
MLSLIKKIVATIKQKIKSRQKKSDFVSDRLKENIELANQLKNENSNCDLYISDRLVEFIKTFEGFSRTIYICPAGKRTIGYGHVVTDSSDMSITENSAEFLLKSDLFRIRRKLIHDLGEIKITQGQFEALVSLSYNAGDLKIVAKNGWKALKNNDFETAAIEFFSSEKGIVFVKNKKMQGLINRRTAELTQLWQN